MSSLIFGQKSPGDFDPNKLDFEKNKVGWKGNWQGESTGNRKSAPESTSMWAGIGALFGQSAPGQWTTQQTQARIDNQKLLVFKVLKQLKEQADAPESKSVAALGEKVRTVTRLLAEIKGWENRDDRSVAPWEPSLRTKPEPTTASQPISSHVEIVDDDEEPTLSRAGGIVDDADADDSSVPGGQDDEWTTVQEGELGNPIEELEADLDDFVTSMPEGSIRKTIEGLKAKPIKEWTPMDNQIFQVAEKIGGGKDLSPDQKEKLFKFAESALQRLDEQNKATKKDPRFDKEVLEKTLMLINTEGTPTNPIAFDDELFYAYSGFGSSPISASARPHVVFDRITHFLKVLEDPTYDALTKNSSDPYRTSIEDSIREVRKALVESGDEPIAKQVIEKVEKLNAMFGNQYTHKIVISNLARNFIDRNIDKFNLCAARLSSR